MHEFQQELDFYDIITPLMNEAGAAIGMGDQTTIDDAMEWHAVRGNKFANAYLKHLNDPEDKRQSDEVEAAFNWHPAWHENDDHSWSCNTPNDPEVWETDKLLAPYRRYLANQQKGTGRGHGADTVTDGTL